VYHAGRGQVVVTGPLARITPYDQVPDPGHDLFCTRDYISHPRDLSVKLEHAGDARLRVVGFRASSAQPQLASVEVQITVTPSPGAAGPLSRHARGP
jgi:hypothetical protein